MAAETEDFHERQMTESAPWRGSLPDRPVRWSAWSNGSTLTKAGAYSRRLKYPADVSSTSPTSRCPATGSSMQVSACVSPSSGPDSCRTATPIALWQYGRRHDCRDYQRHVRTFLDGAGARRTGAANGSDSPCECRTIRPRRLRWQGFRWTGGGRAGVRVGV